MSIFRTGLNIVLFLLFCQAGYGQEIRIEHKRKPGKSKTIWLDKPVMVRSFDGVKVKGMITASENDKLIIEGKEIALDNIMTISGFVNRNSSEKALGLGLTIGAGIVLPVALYYFLGGIAWGMPNGIFVGSTILAFDLLLAYAGTTLMGILPRRFSTMNWEVIFSPADTEVPVPAPIQIPRPSG